MAKKVRAGILGYGRMGRGFAAAMQESGLWEIAAVYDICAQVRELARPVDLGASGQAFHGWCNQRAGQHRGVVGAVSREPRNRGSGPRETCFHPAGSRSDEWW